MIKFSRYPEPAIRRMTNEEVLDLIGEKSSIAIYNAVEAFKNTKTGEMVFIHSQYPNQIRFPKDLFKSENISTRRLRIFFIDKKSFDYFIEYKKVKKKLPKGNFEPLWFNGTLIIAKLYD